MIAPVEEQHGLAPSQKLLGISLKIFDRIPRWAIAHAASDDLTAPLIRAGEVAVVESNGCLGHIPEDGGLYLIEYLTSRHCRDHGYERRTREIVLTNKKTRGWYAQPYAAAFWGDRKVIMSDGPYSDEIHLAEKIVGRVVGIYRPPHPWPGTE